jgi:single-strand DNA-binding protein
MNINNLTIAGYLVADPEQKFTATGKAVTNLRLANNLKTKTDTKTTFIDCVCWERTAEIAGQYLVKGSPVLLEGRLDQQEWVDKTTQAKRSKLILTVNRLHLFPSKSANELQGTPEGVASGPADEIPFGEPKVPVNPFA